MAEQKEGEVIEIATSQEDKNGDKISEVIVRFYGYDRDTANLGTNSVIDAVQELVQKWDQMRKGGGTGGGQPSKR